MSATVIDTVVEFPERLTVIDINNCKSFGKGSSKKLSYAGEISRRLQIHTYRSYMADYQPLPQAGWGALG